MTKTPHDAFFKAVFGQTDHAVACFEAYLPPPLLRHVDFTTVRLAPGSFVDERLRQRHTDLLYEVRMHGEPALLYLLFEHQRTVDPLMAFRVLAYTVRIWDRWIEESPEAGARRLPPVVALVLYHGAGPWTAPVRVGDLVDAGESLRADLGPHIPELEPLLLDLSSLTDTELRGTALCRLALLLFKHIDDPDLPAQLQRWSKVFLEAVTGSGLRALELVIRYVLEAGRDVEPSRLADSLPEGLSRAKEIVMSTAERLREEGRKEGRDEGRDEGLRLSRRMLGRMLELKFGPLGTDSRERVESADQARIDLWSERVLTATSMDEVLADG